MFQFLIFLYWWLQAEETQKKGGMVMCVMVLVALCALMLFVYVLKKILGFWWLLRTGICLFKPTWGWSIHLQKNPAIHATGLPSVYELHSPTCLIFQQGYQYLVQLCHGTLTNCKMKINCPISWMKRYWDHLKLAATTACSQGPILTYGAVGKEIDRVPHCGASCVWTQS